MLVEYGYMSKPVGATVHVTSPDVTRYDRGDLLEPMGVDVD